MNDLLISAQDALKIQSVDLRGTQVSLQEDFEPAALGAHDYVTQEFHGVSQVKEAVFTNGDGDTVHEYRFNHTSGIRAIAQGDQEAAMDDDYQPFVVIVVTFEAKYIATKALSEDEVAAFSENNVSFHVRPYWREYVQSTCARVGLNPLLEIPMHRCNE